MKSPTKFLVAGLVLSVAIVVGLFSEQEVALQVGQRVPFKGSEPLEVLRPSKADLDVWLQMANSNAIYRKYLRTRLVAAKLEWSLDEYRQRVRVSFHKNDYTMHVCVKWSSTGDAHAIAEAVWASLYDFLSENVGNRQLARLTMLPPR